MDVNEVAAKAREALLADAPEHIRRLGVVLRACVESDEISGLGTYLKEQGIEVDEKRLEEFRDVLIVGRIDLMDLAPAARERLRARTLLKQPPAAMTDEYRSAITAGKQLHCRECRYFVTPPNDGPLGESFVIKDGHKACVEFGTKGADEACFGFLSK